MQITLHTLYVYECFIHFLLHIVGLKKYNTGFPI